MNFTCMSIIPSRGNLSGKKQNLIFVSISLLLVFQYACKTKTGKEKITEGEIIYSIEYLENSMTTVSTSLLPKKMVRKFRKGMLSSSMEGFFGMFMITNISDIRNNTNTTLLRVMDNRFRYTAPPGDYGCCFNPYEGMQITFCPERKTIAGFDCSKALVTYGNSHGDSVEIWYSSEIGPSFANRLTPFEPVDGMLMEFNLELQKLKMHFVADEVRKKSMPRSAFMVKGEYVPISKIRMEKIISALME